MSLLFAIGAGCLNNDIAMELILDVGHFYVASYSGKDVVDLLPDGRYAPCYCCYLP